MKKKVKRLRTNLTFDQIPILKPYLTKDYQNDVVLFN